MPGYPSATTGEVSGIQSAPVQLPYAAGEVVLVQADPDNTVNLYLSVGLQGLATPGHQLEPGASFSAELANLDMIWVQSVDGTACRLTYTVLACG